MDMWKYLPAAWQTGVSRRKKAFHLQFSLISRFRLLYPQFTEIIAPSTPGAGKVTKNVDRLRCGVLVAQQLETPKHLFKSVICQDQCAEILRVICTSVVPTPMHKYS